MSSITTTAGSAGSNFISTGTGTWANTTNFTGAANASYATSAANPTNTQSLDGYNFNPSVPGGSTINGFQYAAVFHRTLLQIVSVAAQVTWNSTTSTAGAWTGSNADASHLTTSDATYTWGGSTDLVGLTAPSVSNTNSAVEGTGPTISFYFDFVSGSGSTTINADSVSQTVFYTAGGATTNPAFLLRLLGL